MVILTYVNDKKYGYLCSYASDPVLTFGATKVLYTLDTAPQDYILPELKKLVLDEALDTGDIGGIVMLLVLDKCGMGNNKGFECEFTGQFVLVETFLNLLGVEDTLIKNKWMEDAGAAEWRSHWSNWRMGFTHFVILRFNER
ncbi:hypothetical protein PI124_g21928 [Phytophthora idaei]|nr:hypothetical protein PI125_g23765 [Phytophthora idaei]KAG3127607.1 hypothetical protein PI126_g21780 [Phytophthora idaei]KAG3232994.1 hypothetical protein PI124_g21928 [Phytophthora idaei]